MNAQVSNGELSAKHLHGGISKIDRHGWILVDHPGVLMSVSKKELHVDHDYQRSVNSAKVRSIAREWSWVACGALIVADRKTEFFIVDGQHRWEAALCRSDIDELPVIVFETDTTVIEAAGFLQSNTQRKPITGIDKFKALVVTRDPAALIVQRVVQQVGRQIDSGKTSASVRCPNILLRCAKSWPEELERLFPLIHEVSKNTVISDRFVQGFLYIETHMPSGESLTDSKWRARVLNAGHQKLQDAALKAAAYYCRGGGKIWASGMIEALNYKARNRLELNEVKSNETDSA